MFMNDKVNRRQNEVTIIGIEPETLHALLEFAYTGSIRITKDNVCRLLSGSSYLQLFTVRDACCEFLEKRFQAESILGVRALANQLDCSNLLNAAIQFVDKNFAQIAQSEEYLSLKHADLMNIISREELHENASEEQVFDAVMNWVKKDPDNRKNILPELLSNIRMHLMSLDVLVDHVGKEPLIRTSLECRNLLEEAKDHHLMRLSSSSQTRSESQNDNADFIYALKNGYGFLEKYDVRNDCWIDENPLSPSFFGAVVAVLQDKLYVIGGFQNSSVNVFDPKTRTWSTVASKELGTKWACAAVMQNKIYLCGGYIEGSGPTNAVQCYDPENNRWEDIIPMKEIRLSSCAVVLDDCLYVLGGGKRIVEPYDPCASVEKYDPQSRQWSLSTPMLNRRCDFGAAVLNGKIYVAGGTTRYCIICPFAEVYNPITKQWNHIEPMNEFRQYFSLVSLCGGLYAVGGVGYDYRNLNSVEIYNAEEDKWSSVAPMKKIKGTVTAAVLHKI